MTRDDETALGNRRMDDSLTDGRRIARQFGLLAGWRARLLAEVAAVEAEAIEALGQLPVQDLPSDEGQALLAAAGAVSLDPRNDDVFTG